ncbi:MAG: hypothetical protein QM662_11395 [Gordonia sp. (in: high G+C Gram-positive bacteria)]
MIRRRNLRVFSAAALSAAALALGAPAVAHADGTQDPRYDHPPQTQQCGEETHSGRNGLSPRFRHELGQAGPTSFVLTYDTETEPDKIDVYYQNKLIKTTGWVGDEYGDPARDGQGQLTINLSAGHDTFVEVQVHGGRGQDSTVWKYTVHCPS